MANGLVERFNRVLGERFQATYFEGKSVPQALRDILVSYRSAPHRANGLTPFEVLHGGRRMRTRLTPPVRAPVVTKFPDWKPKVERYQEAYGKRASTGSGPVNLKPGDWVRCRLPQAKKGVTMWSKPCRIKRQVNTYTFELDTGKVWNARGLTAYKGLLEASESPTHDTAWFAGDESEPVGPPGIQANGNQEPDPPPRAANVGRPVRDRRQREFYQAGYA